MGLLQKAAEQSTYNPKNRESLFPGIEKRLSDVKHTVEFYPALFKELVNLFKIEKGALLLREGDIFTLSSIVGYDITTGNRLRLEESEYKTFTTTKNLTLLEKYFSIREFIILSNLYIFPFISGKKVEGLLLISEYQTETNPAEEEIESYVKILARLFGDNPLKKLQKVDSQNSDTKATIKHALQRVKHADNRIIFIKLNVSDLVEKIRSGDNLSTSSSIINTALKILNSFTRNRGSVYLLKGNEIVVTITDETNSVNIMIIQQQINAAFRSIFSNKLSSVDLCFESLIWKNNSLDSILDNLITDEDS